MLSLLLVLLIPALTPAEAVPTPRPNAIGAAEGNTTPERSLPYLQARQDACPTGETLCWKNSEITCCSEAICGPGYFYCQDTCVPYWQQCDTVGAPDPNPSLDAVAASVSDTAASPPRCKTGWYWCNGTCVPLWQECPADEMMANQAATATGPGAATATVPTPPDEPLCNAGYWSCGGECVPFWSGCSESQGISRRDESHDSGSGSNDASYCPGNIATAALTLPTQPELVVPDGQVLILATAAHGVQNYTCKDGAYAPLGALANLYDTACLLTVPLIPGATDVLASKLPEIAFDGIPYPPTPELGDLGVIVKHQHISTPDGIAPVWIRTTDGSTIVGKVTGTVQPDETAIAWVRLIDVGDGWAKTVLRTDTVLGVPPAQCQDGEEVSVPYAANYYFFN